MSRRIPRFLIVALALLIAAGGALWFAFPVILNNVVEGRLVAVGFPDAAADGTALVGGGIAIAQIRLDPNAAFVLDDVELALDGTRITRIAIGELHLATGFDPTDGAALPGLRRSAPDPAGNPVDVIPADGVRIARADIRFATPAGELAVRLRDAQFRHDTAGGAAASATATVTLANSTLEATVAATLARGGAIDARADITGGTLGELSVQAALREDVVDIRLQTSGSDLGTLDLELTGMSLGTATASGRLRLTGSGVTVPGRMHEGTISVAGSIEGNRDALRIEAPGEWTLAFVAGEALGEPVADQAIAVTLSPRGDEPLALDLSLRDATARLTAALSIEADNARIDTAGDFTLRRAPEPELTAERLTISASGIEWQALTLGLADFAGSARFGDAGWQLQGAGVLQADGSGETWSVAGLEADWSGVVAGSATAVSVAPDHCISWSVERLVTNDFVIDPATPPCISATGPELLVYERPAGRLRFAVATAPAPLAISVERATGTAPDAAEPYALAGEWPAMELAGAVGGSAAAELTALVNGGPLVMPGSPAWLVPLTVEANATTAGDELRFDAYLSDALGTFAFELEGHAAGDAGAITLQLLPVRFFEGATSIADLSPRLADTVTSATGTFGFTGDMAWDADGRSGSGVLTLDDFSATVAGIPVTGVQTQTQFTSLWPPATAPAQQAVIESISLGLPLTRGRASYELDTDGLLTILALEFEMAGGHISSEAFTVDSSGEGDSEFALNIEGVTLSQMLEFSQITGLDGTGTLSGQIPIAIAGREVRLADGRLAAVAPGQLRYTPSQLPIFLRGDGERTKMLREALTNFQYDELSVTVNGDSGEDGQQTVRFNALGANPDFLDGHPIDLSFTFRGPLLGAMSSAVEVAGAAAIEELFEQQQLNNPENTQ